MLPPSIPELPDLGPQPLTKKPRCRNDFDPGVFMCQLSAKGHFWLCDGGLQQIGAAQSFTAAITVDLASMQLQHIFQCEKFKHVVLLSKFLKGLLVTSIYLFACFPEFSLPTVIFGGGNPDGGTIRGQLHRALRINLQKVENRPINDKRIREWLDEQESAKAWRASPVATNGFQDDQFWLGSSLQGDNPAWRQASGQE